MKRTGIASPSRRNALLGGRPANGRLRAHRSTKEGVGIPGRFRVGSGHERRVQDLKSRCQVGGMPGCDESEIPGVTRIARPTRLYAERAGVAEVMRRDPSLATGGVVPRGK